MGRGRNDSVLLTCAALGAVSGLRSMAAPALLTHEFSEHGMSNGPGLIEKVLTAEETSRLLALLAGGEMIADKTSVVPDRTSPVPLIGRAVMGSLTAAAYAVNRRYPVLLPAAIGAASAVASTFAAFHLRRLGSERLHIPDRLLGMIEDAVVVAASKGITEAMERGH